MHRIRIVTSREGSRRFRILDPASWLPPVFPSKRGMPDLSFLKTSSVARCELR